MAQAALESGYGQYAFSNNFFGIKDSDSWNGDVQKLKTWEAGSTGNRHLDNIKDDTEIIKIYKPYEAGNRFPSQYGYRVRAKFRAYPTAFEGFADHSKFLKTNYRYNAAFQYTDPYNFAREVAKAGYASAPNYEAILISYVNEVNSYV